MTSEYSIRQLVDSVSMLNSFHFNALSAVPRSPFQEKTSQEKGCAENFSRFYCKSFDAWRKGICSEAEFSLHGCIFLPFFSVI